MANITDEDIKLLSFGYLTGADLLQYCPSQLLISRYKLDPDCFQIGCDQAYAQLDGELSNRYDMETEFAKTEGQDNLLRRLSSIFAIRNIIGIAEGFSPALTANFEWADKIVMRIKNRQTHLKITIASTAVVSDTARVSSSFNYLG